MPPAPDAQGPAPRVQPALAVGTSFHSGHPDGHVMMRDGLICISLMASDVEHSTVAYLPSAHHLLW